MPLGGPLTEAAWPWPWVGVGVVFDLLELVAPIRLGEVLLDFHVERNPLDGLEARRSFRSYGADNVRSWSSGYVSEFTPCVPGSKPRLGIFLEL